VKRNPCAHACSSTRRKKRVKNATKFWICEKVKDFLIVDATLGAAELVKKLKEHLLKRGKVMIVHLKPLKGNLNIAGISLYHHILL